LSEQTRYIKDLARKEGAHLVGIAPVSRFEGAPLGHHPLDFLPGAKSVISIAMRFYHTLLDTDHFGIESELIPPSTLRSLRDQHFAFMYDTCNRCLEWIGLQLAHHLAQEGHRALPLPSSGNVARYTEATGRMRWSAFFSHRHAAALAGLGDIGVNNLLITPQYGPRVRLNSVITTAELVPDDMLPERTCLGERCMQCLNSTPCWGPIWELRLGGKTFPLATFMGCSHVFKPEDGPWVCRRGGHGGFLPFNKNCIGSCPVGRHSG
jgi:epoxyqueuosine reductase